jgi:N-acetylglucosaminyldiphosphoundecaprenol N-acetyl-beta-D-mannosaminyltransferase
MILKENKRKIFNFLNLYSVYLFRKNKAFRESLINNKENNINFIDGFPIAIYLKARKIRGTDFARYFLKNVENAKKAKHFFLGFEKEDIEIFRKKFPKIKNNKLFTYNPPYIKGEKFSEKEIEKICCLIDKSESEILWIGLGNPKQEILAQEIYNKTKTKFIFCIGAALDFLTGKKKEAPRYIRKLKLEWFYRGFVDFKHSNKKIWRSFMGLFYLPKSIELK